jgi:hypothetical protein
MLIPNQLVLCFVVVLAAFIIGWKSSTVQSIESAQPGASPAKYANIVVLERRSKKQGCHGNGRTDMSVRPSHPIRLVSVT